MVHFQFSEGKMLFVALAASLLWTVEGNMALVGSLTREDLTRTKVMFQKTLRESKSLELVAYAAYGMHILHEKFEPSVEKRLCDMVATAAKSNDISTVYHGVLLAVALPSCKPPQLDVQFLERFVSEQSTLKNMCFAVEVASRLGLKLDSNKLRAQTEKFMKTNDSASEQISSFSLAYAFFIAIHLSGNLDPFLGRIEDCVAQADEIDGKYLQYEEGAIVTAQVVSSICALSTHAGKAPSLKQDELVKFSNFLLAHVGSDDPEIAYFVLMALNAVDKNPVSIIDVARLISPTILQYHIPLYVSMGSDIVLSEKNPNVRLHVASILNRPVQKIEVTAVRVVSLGSDSAIVENQRFQMQKDDPSIFTLNLKDSLREAGIYRLLVDVQSSTNEKVLPVKGKEFIVKVEKSIEMTDISFGVVDRDQSLLDDAFRIKYANKVVPLSADNHQRLLGRVIVKDKSSQKPVKVQQAFLQLTERDGGRELTFVATAGKDEYKFDLDFGKLGKLFDHQSGAFEVKLIVGDSVSSNAILQTVATLSLTLPEVYRPPKSPLDVIDYEKKPEIVHTFRQAEKRPPKIVSHTFTFLVVLPILFLPILWMQIGSNLSGYSFSLSGIIFHISFAAIFGLYGLFWLRLNMFETLKYLSIIGSIAFLSGHRVLRYMAERSK
ncbi:hypothetical protein M514_10335 [Trichuris suis]|uniref:Dolichyl-diphosphooligosaccharide--protein glycosyltransferase subunit 2 n=1 Tax=Trichuris suis TaxID=68888 RepID=A0A085NIN5_9BILA|nr:hypothetical protein M514_10335 [Trichuris suis]